MTPLCFRAVIKIININPYVLIGAKRATQLKKDWRKPLPVLVRVKGNADKLWHTNLMPIGD